MLDDGLMTDAKQVHMQEIGQVITVLWGNRCSALIHSCASVIHFRGIVLPLKCNIWAQGLIIRNRKLFIVGTGS